MFDHLPDDLARLITLRTWNAMWLERIDAKIAAVRQREVEQARTQQVRPPRPQWIIELGIGAGRAPVEVHCGDCYAIGKRRQAVTRDEARRLLADGVRACSHCTPDTTLEIPLSSRPALTAAAR
ncbi:DUF6233 domain-containing protein [Streptomyces sp. MMBL 11-3]|uniref:DUF6233 domain-containing protein n=1 Tax=Streptomyces sp. MMBL 11-3 TaxID=3382639 RepID=UPI0039B3FE46